MKYFYKPEFGYGNRQWEPTIQVLSVLSRIKYLSEPIYKHYWVLEQDGSFWHVTRDLLGFATQVTLFLLALYFFPWILFAVIAIVWVLVIIALIAGGISHAVNYRRYKKARPAVVEEVKTILEPYPGLAEEIQTIWPSPANAPEDMRVIRDLVES